MPVDLAHLYFSHYKQSEMGNRLDYNRDCQSRLGNRNRNRDYDYIFFW